MGHTAEEKIKILYEDSLKDIRAITAHMDDLTSRLEAANQPNTLLAGIATEIKLLGELNGKLVQSQAGLLNAIEETKSVHRAQLIEQTKAQVEIFTRAAGARSTAEMQAIMESGQAARTAILKGVGDEAVKIVKERVAQEKTSLNEASDAFINAKIAFDDAVDESIGKTKVAVKKFDEILQASVDKHKPMGWAGQLISIVLAGFAGATLSVLLLAKVLIHP